MFEISIPQIKNCAMNLEEQEKELNRLIRQMENVCTGFDGLVEDKSDKRALQTYLEQMQEEMRNISAMKQTLSEIIHCYETTERTLSGSDVLPGVRNQFGRCDLSQVGQMLENLNIVFK